jgi:23S rRNA-/tRNA-specific pseudouridylate synthase
VLDEASKPAHHGLRLDHFLRQHYWIASEEGGRPAVPLSLLNAWIRKRLLRVHTPADTASVVVDMNNAKASPLRARLAPHTKVIVHPSLFQILRPGKPDSVDSAPAGGMVRAAASMHPPPWVSTCTRHADAAFVAISKPDGVATQGGTGVNDRHTVDFWLPAIDRAAAAAAAAAAGPATRQSKGVGLPAAAAPAASPAQGVVGVGGGSGSSAGDLKLVHRLDKDVSGLLLLARGREAAEQFRRALAGRYGIDKEYLAFVAAPLPRGVPLAGHVDEPLADGDDGDSGRGGGERSSSSSSSISSNGGSSSRVAGDAAGRTKSTPGERPGSKVAAAAGAGGTGALTEYVALPLRAASPDGACAGDLSAASDVHGASLGTLLVLRPISGRKHQLRQHVVALFRGAAGIAGDDKYGPRGGHRGGVAGSAAARPGGGAVRSGAADAAGTAPFDAERLMLHSWRVTIEADVLPRRQAAGTAGAEKTAAGSLGAGRKQQTSSPSDAPADRAELWRAIRSSCRLYGRGDGDKRSASPALVKALKDGSVRITDQVLPPAFIRLLSAAMPAG